MPYTNELVRIAEAQLAVVEGLQKQIDSLRRLVDVHGEMIKSIAKFLSDEEEQPEAERAARAAALRKVQESAQAEISELERLFDQADERQAEPGAGQVD